MLARPKKYYKWARTLYYLSAKPPLGISPSKGHKGKAGCGSDGERSAKRLFRGETNATKSQLGPMLKGYALESGSFPRDSQSSVPDDRAPSACLK